jgi:hypothetical protein
MHAAWRGHGHFRSARRCCPHERELIGRDAARALDLPFDVRRLKRGAAAIAVVKIEDRILGGQALDRVNESIEPRAAAELAIGNRLQTDVFLHPDCLTDTAVLDLGEFAPVDFALRRITKRRLEFGRTQQAANVLGAERGRLAWLGHASTSTDALVSRFRSSHNLAAPPHANFGFGALAQEWRIIPAP